MTVLIFGTGYLGAALAADRLARGRRVVGLDNGFSTDRAALERLASDAGGRFTLLAGDVRSAADVERAFAAAAPVETVFMLAAQASAHPQAAPPEYTEETNLRGPRLVFEAALRHDNPPVIYGSSFHVYGSALEGRVDEDRRYGAVRDLSHLSKIYVEKLAEMYALGRGLRVAPVRLGVVYGVGPVTKQEPRFVTVPHAFCLRALAGEALEVHAGGLRPMAFVHLDDAVDALLRAAPDESGGRADSGVYAPANAASEVATVTVVARLVEQAAAARGLAVTVRLPEGGGQPSFAVHSRLFAAGWQPRRTLAAAVPEILAHYRARQEGGI
ncbi:MAG: NAD(P)-dependent oxidoreductase [Chloroflexi bacterium]|nr:NAD(P)-dependent oxidoreductase [Chloroflexota bacterium]